MGRHQGGQGGQGEELHGKHLEVRELKRMKRWQKLSPKIGIEKGPAQRIEAKRKVELRIVKISEGYLEQWKKKRLMMKGRKDRPSRMLASLYILKSTTRLMLAFTATSPARHASPTSGRLSLAVGVSSSRRLPTNIVPTQAGSPSNSSRRRVVGYSHDAGVRLLVWCGEID